MVRIVRNERSWAIELIGFINYFLRDKTMSIANAGGETTINNHSDKSEGSRSIMFPDILLYGDSNKSRILQGWEIKLPDTPVINTEFIKDAQYKADVLGLNSTILWNFNEIVLYIKDEKQGWRIEHTWHELNHIRTREDVGTYQEDWVKVLGDVLLRLNSFFREGKIAACSLEMLISDSIMSTILLRNQNIVAEYLENKSTTNRQMQAYLNQWWSEIQHEYLHDEKNMYLAYSKNILVNWINRFTFAHLIKALHNPAKGVEAITKRITPLEANEIFVKITKSCDFYTIFSAQKFNELLPTYTWEDLLAYNSFMIDQGFNALNQEALQLLLENSVHKTKREIIGQYTTPPLLAELLVKITVENLEANVIDPCCGTGTIPKAVLKLKKESVSAECAHMTTWASDKFSFPLQIANLGMTDFSTINIPNKIFQENVFDLDIGKVINITSPIDGTVIEYKIPKFDNVISNLPFVPFEIISKDEKEHLERIIHDTVSNFNIKVDRRSDIYTYIIIHIWSILNDGGKVGLIVSNAWLGTVSGKKFYNILEEMFYIDTVVISGKGRWFKNAKVVTTLLVLKKKNIDSSEEYDTYYSLLKVSLEELGNKDLLNQVADSLLTRQSMKLETIDSIPYSQHLQKTILSFNLSRNALFHDVGWITNMKGSLIPLNEQFLVLRGVRRGWDAMFFPNEEHKIENEYLERVLFNSRNILGLTAETDRDAFCCSKTLEELKESGDQGALEWINRFENGVNNVGVPLVKSLQKSAGAGRHWYEMNTESIAEIVTTLNPDRRLMYSKIDQPAFINQRLIGLRSNEKCKDIDLNHALLNSVISLFFIEASGFGRGLGALDLNKSTFEKSFMLNPDLLSLEQKKKIKDAFSPLLQRDILPLEDEFRDEDRIHFEQTVLRAYDLGEYYEKVTNSLLSIHRTRLTARD